MINHLLQNAEIPTSIRAEICRAMHDDALHFTKMTSISRKFLKKRLLYRKQRIQGPAPPCALHPTKQNPRAKMTRGFIKIRFP